MLGHYHPMSIRESAEPRESADKQARLVVEIRRISHLLGVNRLSQREFEQHRLLGSPSTVGYQFGSWNRAVVAAGLLPNPPGGAGRASELEASTLLEEVLRLRDELQKMPSERELSRFGRHSLKPYRDRWGTFRQARKAAIAYEAQRSSPHTTA